jgi:hypothetical protein
MGSLQERPGLTRAIGAMQIAGGVWWALQQEREHELEHALTERESLPI